MQHVKVQRAVELAARLGSIRKAAEVLNTASTAVTRSILALEHELGTPLFERLPHGVRPTPAGALFVEHLRRTRVDLDRVLSEMEALRGLHGGSVGVAASEAVAGSLLPAAVAAFQERFPRIRFTVQIAGNERIVAAVTADEADCGLVFNPPDHPEFSPVRAVTQRLHAVMAADHPLAGRDALALCDCLAYPLALPDRSKAGRRLLDGLLAAADLTAAPAVVSDSFEFMESYCLERGAVFFQIAVGAARPALAGRLVARPIRDRGAEGRLVLGVHRGRAPTVQAAAFIAFLGDRLHGDPA